MEAGCISTVWQDAIANEMLVEQAAERWDLPIAAVHGMVQFCGSQRDFIRLEADKE